MKKEYKSGKVMSTFMLMFAFSFYFSAVLNAQPVIRTNYNSCFATGPDYLTLDDVGLGGTAAAALITVPNPIPDPGAGNRTPFVLYDGTGTTDTWITDANGTPSANTGPGDDDPCDNDDAGNGFYMFFEGSGALNTDTTSAFMEVDLTNIAAGDPAVFFHMSYHMFGTVAAMGDLYVEVEDAAGRTIAFRRTGPQHISLADDWDDACVNLAQFHGQVVTVSINYSPQGGFQSDAAVDNIYLAQAATNPCRIDVTALDLVDGVADNQVVFPMAPGTCAAVPNTLPAATISGDCLASSAGAVIMNDAPANFPPGTTTVTFWVEGAGTPKAVAIDVVVLDQEAPIIACPAAPGPFDLLPGECEIIVTFDDATFVSDNCPIGFAPLANNTSPQVFSIGPGATSNQGVMFDLVNNHPTLPLEITTFNIITGPLPQGAAAVGGSTDIEIFTTPNGQGGKAFNAGAWTSQGVSSVTNGWLTNFFNPLNTSLIIPPNTTIGVFLASVNNSGWFYSGHITPIGTTISSGPLDMLGGGPLSFAAFNGATASNFALYGTIDFQTLGAGVPELCTDSPASGDAFSVGSTEVTFCLDDAQGNTGMCSFDIVVNSYADATTTLACNDVVQFSLDENGCTLASSDIVLEGGPYGCYLTDYTMTRIPSNSSCTDPKEAGEVWFDCSDVGREVTVRVTDPATGSSCWGKVTIEDKISPVVTCPPQSYKCTENSDPILTTPPPRSGQTVTETITPNETITFSGTRTFEIDFSGCTNIEEVQLFLSYESTDPDDFGWSLTSPSGTTVQLVPGSFGGVGCVMGALADWSTTFVDGGTAALSCPPAQFTDPRPGNLSAFIGEDPEGIWIITGDNVFTTDEALVKEIGLIITATCGVDVSAAVSDNCNIQEFTYQDSDDSEDCASGLASTITRTWKATDVTGNTTLCTQTITIERPELDDVELPEGITYLDCSTEVYPDPGASVCIKDTTSFIGLNAGPFPDPGLGGLAFDIDNDADTSRYIKDINIRLALDHGDVSELQLAIARLDINGQIINGTTVPLYTAVPEDNYVACSNAIQMGVNITFDDEGCVMPHEPCANFAPSVQGQYIPASPLSLYDGQLVNNHANPDWVILITDIDGPNPPNVNNTTNGFPTLQDIEVTYIYQDRDVLTVPTIAGGAFETGDLCGLTSSYSDERVDICPSTYKIIRTWTVIDWCSGNRIETDQLIKVVDTCPPVLDAPRTDNDDRHTLDIPVYTPSSPLSGAHHACTGNATVPPITLCTDNCSGADASTWETSLYSADGTTLLGTVAANGGTFNDVILNLNEGADDDKAPGTIVLPDLSTPFLFDSIRINVDSEILGEPDAIYLVKYQVSDNCGNTAEAEVFIRVLDKVPPIPVVREETQLSLQGFEGDTTELCASDLDEGSFDNCSGTHFFIRKMLNDNDTDPIGNLDFGFGPDPTLTFEIFGRDGAGTFDLARDFVYKSCTSFTCADIGTDNQVFVLVVDDYVVNFINDYLNSVFEFVDAIVDYSVVPLTILPADRLDDEEDQFSFNDDNGDGFLSQDEVRISVDRDRRNRGQRNFEFYLNEDPRADNLFIIHTAILWEGHYNFAMVNVHVEDKVRPECVAPEDVWINCDALQDNIDFDNDAELDDLFGTAIVHDNCNATLTHLAVGVDLDLCGVGTITRNFRAEDDFGNRSLGTCRQTIMVMGVTSYEILIPGDFQEECDDASPATVEYSEFGCDLLALSSEDENFDASPDGECKKIVRTYKLINWCEYDGASPATVIPRLDINNDGVPGDGNGGSRTPTNHAATNTWQSNGQALVFVPNPLIAVASTGYYSYTQHIKIFDNTAPDVSYDGDTKFCGGDLDEDPCTGQVDIDVNASDLCTNTTTLWELDAFSDSFVSADDDGNGAFSGRLPLGTHTLRFTVADECGNFSWHYVTFDVVDCKAPTPVCHNGLSIDVMPLSGMVELWASDFDASSFDYCHPFELRINAVTDINGDGVITADDYVTTLPSDDNVVLTCADVQAGLTMVQLWVHELSTDGMMDDDYCVTFVEVQDNNNVCAGSRPTVSGKIANEEGETVQNVSVEVNSGMAAMTTSTDGAYNFNLPADNDYTVTPMRLDDAANGVSTFDLIKISRHILNVELLDSPYKMIAGDANNSGNLSTVDLIAIRKVILRVADEFPNNTSWRFVDKSYTFVNAAKPLAEDFREVINLNNLQADVTAADFVAIKVGDVNGDATPNSILGVDGRTFNGNMILKASEQSVEAGEEFTVEFTAAQDVEGYQFTLDYNEKAVELVDVVDGLATEAANFNVAEGQVATSWNQAVSTKGQVMFSLVFRAKDAIEVSNVMSVNSAITAAEAYGVNGELMGISLEFDGAAATAQFELAQNTPNPFKTETVIGFTLPEASNATLTVSDVTGKVLKVVTGDFAKGYNQISMKRADVGVATGVLSYRLEANGNTATKQMIVIE